jgi:glyceraldehyde-3-phosphate dehydrogenase/erythrose-4-phosphate dehydrogenase
MVKIPINGFGRLGRLAFMSSVGADSLNYAELKETAEELMQPTLPTVFVPKELFDRFPHNIILEQEAIHHCIIKPCEYMVVKLPIMENLALADKLRDIICQKSIVDVDTEDLPKERYHDRTFPKNFWKKKKAKRRIQKQSRKRR